MEKTFLTMLINALMLIMWAYIFIKLDVKKLRQKYFIYVVGFFLVLGAVLYLFTSASLLVVMLLQLIGAVLSVYLYVINSRYKKNS